MNRPLHWDPETLWQTLEPLAPGLSVEILPTAGSTSTELLERSRRGLTEPCLLLAERQTAGRGRLGRSWWSDAAPGSTLTFSLGLRLAPADWSGLSLVVGLALAEALDPAGDRLGLKWPNDLWLRGQDRKLGGLLIEVAPLADATAPNERWLVIGVGLNIAPRPAQDLDPALFRTGHAGLQEIAPALAAPAALHRIARPLLRAVLDFGAHGGAQALARFATRDVLAGRRVQIGEQAGVACGIGHDGALLLRDDAGRLHTHHSGEASVRPC
ncbi:MAG: hypothetical protein RLZZ592_2367 [Pseudomonadota bacterium]|jgi:BirA family biotin operon repressor/biotin-[acetyl-CoA-carboxylase] ligase